MSQTLEAPDFIDNFENIFFKNYANFKDRTRRSDFWRFELSVLFLAVLLNLPALIYKYIRNNSPPISLKILIYIYIVISIILFLPSLALTVRRLHDIGRSGWWILIGFTGIGIIILLVWFCSDGTRENNEYGPSPKYVVMLNPEIITGDNSNDKNNLTDSLD